MDLGLEGKKVFINGATKGIGLSIAEAFASEKCNIAICARTDIDVKNTVNKLRQQGINVVGETIDIRNGDAYQDWIDRAADKLGGIDIFISNVSAQANDWEKCFNTDIQACITGVEKIIPWLEKSEAGCIVALSSKAAMLNVPSYKPYSAMKAALISYMSSLSTELASKKIRVNTVSPGEIYFEGGFWHRMETEDPKLVRETLSQNTFGRFGLPQEVAKVVVFLASAAASYISGTNLLVDGGSRQHVQF